MATSDNNVGYAPLTNDNSVNVEYEPSTKPAPAPVEVLGVVAHAQQPAQARSVTPLTVDSTLVHRGTHARASTKS